MEYGVQMYSLRDITGEDLEGALRAVAGMGYKTVEFAGFFGHGAGEVRGMLDRFGLRVIGTHSDWSDLRDDYAGTVRFHKELGNSRFIIPGADLGTKKKLDDFIDFVNEVSPKLRKDGIELGYHNHAHEFRSEEFGYLIHKELEERADLFFEIDTYWAFVAKQDPVALLDRLKGRVRMIHLKDGTPDGNGLALGEGSAPVAAVVKKAVEQGLDIVVESEGCKPTGKEEVKRCIDYLKTLG